MIAEQHEQSSSDSRHDEKSSDSRVTSVESSDQDKIESREWAAGEENPKLSFDDASIRAAFVRKVFAIVTIMLIVNVILVMPVLFIEQLRMFVRHGWIQSVALLVFLVTYFSIICCSPVARRFPFNIMMLSMFTFSAGALLTALCASVPPYTVALALTTTATTCFAVIVFSSQTTYNITSCTFVIFAMIAVACSFGTILTIASMFLQICAFHTVISAVFCMVFIIHLALEIQMIIGGRRHDISPEEYIFAALMLFVDIYEIFINILNLLNTSD